MNNLCSIPNKCPGCGEHQWCHTETDRLASGNASLLKQLKNAVLLLENYEGLFGTRLDSLPAMRNAIRQAEEESL